MLFKNVFCVGVLLSLQPIAFAQSKLDSIHPLDEVTVVADRYREMIPSQRLSGEKLEALSSFSVADAIRYFSGVQIKDYGGIGGLKTVDIRSMGTNHTGVFYEGIEIGNAQNGTVDLGKFSLDNIEEISLYNGQKSEIFQSAKDFGSAGAIYLRTRQPRFTGNKKTNLNGYFRTGSFDLLNSSVLWEQKISSKDARHHVSASLNAEYIDSSGKYKFRHTVLNADGSIANDTTAMRQNGDIRSLRLEGGINGYIGDDGKWHAKAYLYNSEKGLPGAIVNNVWKNSQRQWDRNVFVQGSFQKRLFANHDFLANVKYSSDFMRYLNPDTALMLVDNKFRQQEIYISTANKYAIFPAWDIGFSVDYQWNILDADLRDFVNPKRHTALAALATAFEWGRWKAQASLLGTFVFEEVTRIQHSPDEDLLPNVATGTPNNKQEFTPAVFASYQPFPEEHIGSPLRLRAFYKHIFRMPTFNDLYYTDIGNIALKPEYTTQYNIGFQYVVEMQGLVSLQIRADAYYNQVINKIVATPKGGSGGGSLYRWTMKNIDYVEIRGVDVSLQAAWKLPYNLTMNTNLSYTFQKAQNFTPSENKTDKEFYGGQIDYIPWHSGSVIANAIWKTWDFNYSFIYVGERYHTSANIPVNYEPPWYASDMSVGKTFVLRKNNMHNTLKKCKITVEINNLLDQQFEVIHNYPMPGRNYKLILKIDL
jgi:outer membrane cobalamin receptor